MIITPSAMNRGNTSTLIRSVPNTASASSSSRIFRAPRSEQMAVPATPATTIPLIHVANSRTDAMIENAPNRSGVANVEMIDPPVIPGAPHENTAVQNNNGMNARFTHNHDCSANSEPQLNGGVTAAHAV